MVKGNWGSVLSAFLVTSLLALALVLNLSKLQRQYAASLRGNASVAPIFASLLAETWDASSRRNVIEGGNPLVLCFEEERAGQRKILADLVEISEGSASGAQIVLVLDPAGSSRQVGVDRCRIAIVAYGTYRAVTAINQAKAPGVCKFFDSNGVAFRSFRVYEQHDRQQMVSALGKGE